MQNPLFVEEYSCYITSEKNIPILIVQIKECVTIAIILKQNSMVKNT